jgi:hypothetical protein
MCKKNADRGRGSLLCGSGPRHDFEKVEQWDLISTPRDGSGKTHRLRSFVAKNAPQDDK